MNFISPPGVVTEAGSVHVAPAMRSRTCVGPAGPKASTGAGARETAANSNFPAHARPDHSDRSLQGRDRTAPAMSAGLSTPSCPRFLCALMG